MNTTETSKWISDPTHSELLFKIKHLMITNVKGEFQKFNVSIESKGNDFSDAKVSAVIDTDSIFTNNTDRDAHLRSADFFDAEKYPKITFNSTELNKLDDDNYQLKGILDLHGIEKELILDVEFGGFAKDPYGNHKAGFSVSGKLNRKDWGLNWNAALEAGGVMVSDEVRINAEIQFVQES
ncbi:YceI family protein [Albibacterium profundi]|uniref:YceI family protein n=1 Tax=Albibacterium profundi TaxID=3134906 RepID=A0ABV5CIN2_9SPHI